MSIKGLRLEPKEKEESKMYKGIDVSQWQGAIDWNKVAQVGIEFAIIRSLRGSLKVDPYFEDNFNGARSNGIAIGIYKYSYATNVDFARKEAEAIIKLLAGRKVEAKIWFDIEDKCQENLDKTLLYNIIKTFLDTIANAGYEVGIYCNTYWYTTVLTEDIRRLTKNWWLAQWTNWNGITQGKPDKGEIGWQYSNEGCIDGITGAVDLDYYYASWDDINDENTSTSNNSQPASSKFKKGDIVKVNKAIQYDNGQPFKCWYSTYEVLSVDGKKVVIGKGNTITAGISEDNISLVTSSNNEESAAVSNDIVVGSSVKVLNPIQYDNGKPFVCWYPTYTVIEVKGDRVVIGKGAVKTAAIKKEYLQLV